MSLRHRTTYNQYKGNVRTVAPAVLAVSVSELEDWLKIPTGAETANLTIMIEAAINQIEQFLGCCLITQTFQLSLDSWPQDNQDWWSGVRQGALNELSNSGRAGNIELPRYPLQSVDTITVDGSSITIADYFLIDTAQNYGRLVLKRGKTFPIISDLSANAVLITYTSGYGNASTDVPNDLRLAALQLSAFMFNHRGDGCSASKAFKESGAKDLCSSYKIGRL